MTETASHTEVGESVSEFRDRARQWLAANMPRLEDGATSASPRDEDASWQRARELQAMLFEGGFAGVCFPREYGGLGLDISYQKALDQETLGYEMPLILNAPSFAICCATILDTGTEQQKSEHIAAALRGDEILVQLLSEPSGGSDLAGVITRADQRDGTWILNGAKTWSSGAFAADYGLCLVRTNWDVPKHEGLTMFLVPIGAPGITLRRIKQVNGSTEFCEEFFDDVQLDDGAVVGEVNQGWAVTSRQLYHERRAVGNSSEFSSGLGAEGSEPALDLVSLVERTGQSDNERVREMVGRALAHRTVRDQLSDHIYRSVLDESLPPTAGSISRLFMADADSLSLDTAFAIAGPSAAVGGALDIGTRYMSRQGVSLGGGSTEMARNIISERILNFPREYAADRGVPFNQVRQNRAT